MYPMSYRPPADRECFLAAPWSDDDYDGQATESMDCSSGVSNLYAAEHDLGELNARANSGLISPRFGVIPFSPDFSVKNSGLMSPRSGEIPPSPVEENCWGDVVDTRTEMLFDITPMESLEARNNSILMDPNPILFGCNVTENNLDLLFSTSTTLNQMLENDSKFPPEEPAPKRENLPISNENESLVNVFDQFQQGSKSNAMIVHNDDYYNSPEMQVVDQEKICPRILPTGPPTGPPTKPYTPFTDHNYTELMFNPLVPIKIEVKDECSSDVDVWNDPGQPSPPIADSDPPSPLPCKRTRRSKAKAQVSINRAAKTAKRQRSTSSMTTRKHQKAGNSLETSPSGSDSEDPKSPMPPPRRVPAKRGKKTTSAKPTKSEVQRNTHNMNEKMRRTQMTRELNIVRNCIPQFIYDKEKCSKSKASKQKVLNAARRFVEHLKEEQKGGAVTSQEYLYHNLKEELSVKAVKKAKLLKKFMDKYYKVKGYHYTMRR